MKTINLIAGILITFLAIACQQNQKKGTSTRIIEQNTAYERTFQNAMTKMESYQAIVKKHEDIYNLAMKKKGSILNKREATDAAKEIVKNSKLLFDLANQTISNERVISNVSGAKNKISEYKAFAERKIKEYE